MTRETIEPMAVLADERKQLITKILLSIDFKILQENISFFEEQFGFKTLQEYIDYCDRCYSHVEKLDSEFIKQFTEDTINLTKN